MRKRASDRSVEAEALFRLRRAGAQSDVMEARIEYMDAEGLSRYARGLLGQERIYPDVLIHSQASGRFSTTKPPLVNFPAKDGFGVAWGLILPNPGTFWIHFDLSAIHQRISVAYTQDPVDKEAFTNGWDIHLVRACPMFKMPFPPDRSKKCHDDPSCAEWRASWDPAWTGEKDRRRRLAKVMGYALLLGVNEKAALESKEVAELGLDRPDVLRFARMYLRSKPHLVQAKKVIFAKCAQERVARCFMGSLRRLYGDAKQKGKDGWSHILQGGEQSMMQTIILDLHDAFPEARWVLYSHDGYTFSLPISMATPETFKRVRGIVERTWDVEGTPIWAPADFETLWPDATVKPMEVSPH